MSKRIFIGASHAVGIMTNIIRLYVHSVYADVVCSCLLYVVCRILGYNNTICMVYSTLMLQQ